MQIHFYFDNSARVRMWSENNIDAPNFQHKKMNILQMDFEKLKENWHGFVRNGRLEFEKPPHILKQEKNDAIEAFKQKAALITDKNARETMQEIFNLIQI